MITDAEIKVTGMQSLIDALGEVEAERFISLILRENFDYTKWQADLFNEQSLEQLSQDAQRYYDEDHKK